MIHTQQPEFNHNMMAVNVNQIKFPNDNLITSIKLLLSEILHANECEKLSLKNIHYECKRKLCEKTKLILRHTKNCDLLQNCINPNCFHYKVILTHFNNCSEGKLCKICKDERAKLYIQEELRKCLHAVQCLNDENCNFIYCQDYKKINQHIVSCNVNSINNCNDKQCQLLKPLLIHWTVCKDGLNCDLCRPFRVQNIIGNGETSDNNSNNKERKRSRQLKRNVQGEPLKQVNQNQEQNSTDITTPMNIDCCTKKEVPKSISEVKYQPNHEEQNSMFTNDQIHGKINSKISSNDSIYDSIDANIDFIHEDHSYNKSSSNDTYQLQHEQTPSEEIPINISENLRVFTADELINNLLPTLETLIRQEPESLPFMAPVDPINLGISDYFEIVKKPMDLGTVKNNLLTGKYSDPWEYVDDVWLMFDNAWLYNRKTSRVYRYCTKLSEVFEQEIDPVMQALGFCCGRKYTFCPQVLCCNGKQSCTIAKNAKYYSYQNKYLYCEKCFKAAQDKIEFLDDQQTKIEVMKNQFIEMLNVDQLEPFINCKICDRKHHQICSLHLDEICPNGFICDSCLVEKCIPRNVNNFTAEQLPISNLSQHIEHRVNNFLNNQNTNEGTVHIRMVSNSNKIVKVDENLRCKFENFNDLPYKAKILFAFQEVNGVDVCFFGMHVQEYGSECPAPNTRRVYIAYLDSVHFFKPRQYRTAVYHEILLGYMDYVKQLGFKLVNIWPCPPLQGDDYIFHCHPINQNIPKPERLQKWYMKMLEKGMIERTIQDFKDDLKKFKRNNNVILPYFEGDIFTTEIQKFFHELKILEKKYNKRQKIDFSSYDKFCLMLLNKLKKLNQVYFTAKLDQTNVIANQPIIDPDPIMDMEYVCGRDALLTTLRKKNLEFSTFRRAQYSTLIMLNKIHKNIYNFNQKMEINSPMKCCSNQVAIQNGNDFNKYMNNVSNIQSSSDCDMNMINNVPFKFNYQQIRKLENSIFDKFQKSSLTGYQSPKYQFNFNTNFVFNNNLVEDEQDDEMVNNATKPQKETFLYNFIPSGKNGNRCQKPSAGNQCWKLTN